MKTITVDKDGAIDIRQFKDFVDISKVEFYSIKKGKEPNTAVLKFYDKKKKLIKPVAPKKEKK